MNLTPLETVLLSIILTAIITLLLDNAYIRFKAERFFRYVLGSPLISVRLNTRCVSCKNGFLLLHGISIKNKMWFTHKLPKTFYNAPLSLNLRGPCDYFADEFFKTFAPLKLKELYTEYLKCNLKTTSDPSKRSLDMYKESEITVEIITEPIELKTNKPFNKIKEVGELHLSSRNLMPILKPGEPMTIYVTSKEFGLIGKIKVQIPEDLLDSRPISDPQELENMENPPLLLSDIGVPILRWPIRLKIVDVSC